MWTIVLVHSWKKKYLGPFWFSSHSWEKSDICFGAIKEKYKHTHRGGKAAQNLHFVTAVVATSEINPMKKHFLKMWGRAIFQGGVQDWVVLQFIQILRGCAQGCD